MGSLIPWSDETPENANLKGMVMKWQIEAGRMMNPTEEEAGMANKRIKGSLSWTECKVYGGRQKCGAFFEKGHFYLAVKIETSYFLIKLQIHLNYCKQTILEWYSN